MEEEVEVFCRPIDTHRLMLVPDPQSQQPPLIPSCVSVAVNFSLSLSLTRLLKLGISLLNFSILS